MLIFYGPLCGREWLGIETLEKPPRCHLAGKVIPAEAAWDQSHVDGMLNR